MGKKKKQKKKPINWQELAISAVIDLIIGTILIIIGKYIGQGESPNQQAGNKPAAYKKYNTNPKPSKEYALKLGVFLVAVGLVKLLVAFILRAREKRGKA